MRILSTVLLIVCAATLFGCGASSIYPDMSDDAIAFEMDEFCDEYDDDALYAVITYDGRLYMPYGTLGTSLQADDIDQCLGYIIQDENSSSVIDPNDTQTRLYTLTDDSNHDYLMEYYIGEAEMNQPSFYRAADTRGEDIHTPDYIDDLEYNYWTEPIIEPDGGNEMSNEGKKCKVHYTGTFNDGTKFDSSYDRGEPLEFVCGAGMMIKGFDEAVKTMKVGDIIDIHLMPEEAYGMPNPDMIFTVAISELPGAEGLEAGQQVYLTNQYGQPFQVVVTEKDDENITFDANHEMAGKELNFKIELVEVSE